jgi:hypothetical protein
LQRYIKGYFKAFLIDFIKWKMWAEENTELWLTTCFTGQRREEKTSE